MKKSQLRNIIRESINQLMTEQTQGCTDPNAANYFSSATNDCCCVYPGCTDPTASNYSFPNSNPQVTATNDPYDGDPPTGNSGTAVDDGSCIGYAGCTDSTACNYDVNASTDDGSCEFTSCAGCTDNTANNYDYNATIDDGSCDFTVNTAGVCNPTMGFNNSGTKDLDWWNNKMQGKIDNALINKPWMANNTNGNGNNDQPCKFIDARKDKHQNKLNNGLTTTIIFYKPRWMNQLNCKIESLSSGGYLANLYGC
tara:strand:+ start:57 stop:818 length:762 start_codon:yes stop_codon:yes gene_type:complete